MTFIKKSDGTEINIIDKVIDRDYAVGMVGYETEDYMTDVSQTLFQKLENYASDVPPESNQFVNAENGVPNTDKISVTGQLWYDTEQRRVKIYNADISSSKFGWTPIFSNTTEISIIPTDDNVQDLGTTTRYWHSLYATHLNANTNRLVDGPMDMDGNPSIDVNGNIILKNSNPSSRNISTISPADGAAAIIGEASNPFNETYSSTVRFGAGKDAGMSVDNSAPHSIVPSNDQESSLLSSVVVNLGSEEAPFIDAYTTTLNVSTIHGFAQDNTVIIANGQDILVETGNTVSIGTSGSPVGSMHSEVLTVTRIEEVNNFSSTDAVANYLFDEGVSQVVGGTLDIKADKVNVRNPDTKVLKKINIYALMPRGMITMWGIKDGTIPSGWRVCNGNSYIDNTYVSNYGALTDAEKALAVTTPDFRTRFVLSTSSTESYGANGGTSSVIQSTEHSLGTMTTTESGLHTHGGTSEGFVLTEDEIPKHSHSYQQITGTEERAEDEYNNNPSILRENNTKVSGGGETAEGNLPTTADAHTHSIGVRNSGDAYTDVENGLHSHTITVNNHSHAVDLLESKIFKTIYIMKVI